MDNLEKFINENREAFDEYTPSPKVWENIEHEIIPQATNKNKVISLRWITAVAASIIVGIVAWNVMFTSEKDHDQPIAAHVDPVIEAIDPHYAVQVKSVNQQIKVMHAQLEELVKDNPNLSENLLKNLEHLSTTYEVLRSNLNETVNQEILLKKMIENLNLQVSILSQQLNLIQQIKNETSNEINI